MLKRAVFGAIYVALIVAGILCGPFFFLILLLMLSTLAINEFLNLTNPEPDNNADVTVAMLLRSIDCVGAAVLIVSFWTNMLFMPGLMTYLTYIVLRLTIQLWIHSQNALQSLSASFMAQVYIALPIALMNVIYHMSAHMLLLMFVLVWVNDTFAYLFGSRFGSHRLWQRISPKKSWEGFWGGLAMTCLTAFLCGHFAGAWFAGHSAIALTIIGLAVSLAGTLGDLTESLLKRTVGVKDSGQLIPGHGGILDRIDSILLVIPSVVIITYFMSYYAI